VTTATPRVTPITREDWERMLDEDPGDLVTRLAYADWLEDRGQDAEGAAGHRWLAGEGKWPQRLDWAFDGRVWQWRGLDPTLGPGHCYIPDERVLKAVCGLTTEGRWPTRQAAEAKMLGAIRGLPEGLGYTFKKEKQPPPPQQPRRGGWLRPRKRGA
jgi:uncharacterized protein (TIGR02996 family)